MAKADWAIVSPASGSGDSTVNVSAEEHTGRLQRQTTLTVTGTGVAQSKSVVATQSPKAEFVAFDNLTDLAVAQAGGNVTITGKTNSTDLTFAWITPQGQTQPEWDDQGGEGSAGVDYPAVVIPATYLANGADTDNGGMIEGDPGATAEFAFSITLNFPANDSINAIHRVLGVTAGGGQVAQLETIQAANDPYLNVSPLAITIPQAGTPAVSIEVESNTSWTVS